jgi:protein-S-isoprenylcysteine O-methyltransferase Ste14
MWLVAHSRFSFPVAVPFRLPLALLLAAIGIAFAASAIRRFKKAETTVNPLQPDTATALVDTGIFARTRNPMYLGLLLVLLGWGVWLQSLANIIVLAAFVLFITEFQIKPEERALQKVFGEAYADYAARVRRWI